MLGPIPFEVPAMFAAQLSNGSLVRAGALLKDASSGQIVAHLQETGLAQNILGNIVGSPFSPISALSSAAANVQLVQIKAMLEGLQILQYANLGATVAGIGVSAIGFALMNKKLNGLQRTTDKLAVRIEEGFKDLHMRELRGHYSKIHGLFDQADQAFHQTNPLAKWQLLERDLADESAYFRGEVAFHLQSETFSRVLFEAFTRSYTLCNAGRIECLVLSNELKAAYKVSKDVSDDYNRLFDPMVPFELARKSDLLVENKDVPHDELLKQEMVSMRDLVSNIRDAQDAAMSKPYLLEMLMDRDIDGHEYMRQLREEKEQPLLLLRAD